MSHQKDRTTLAIAILLMLPVGATGTANAAVTAVSSNAVEVDFTGQDLSEGGTENDLVQISNEQQCVELGAGNGVEHDQLVTGVGEFYQDTEGVGHDAILEPGRYSSHLIHYDPPGNVETSLQDVSFTFDGEIVAFSATTSRLGYSDATFGVATTYSEFRYLHDARGSIQDGSGGNRNQLTLDAVSTRVMPPESPNNPGEDLGDLRVITRCPPYIVCPSSCPYTTIQEAISNGDDPVITIAPGQYDENLIIDRDVVSEGPGEAVGLAKIRGGNTGRTIKISGDYTVTLRTVTVRDGLAGAGGGGIVCTGCDLTLEDVRLRSNRSEGSKGGGLLLKGDNPKLKMIGGDVVGNSVAAGGSGAGIAIKAGTADFEGVTFSGNITDGCAPGAPIQVYDNAQVNVTGCTFED